MDNIPVYTSIVENKRLDRPRVVVLGSGWGAMSFIKALPKSISEQYEVVLMSPRNYFLYTPLLPAVATGTVEERSIVEPVRKTVLGKGDYYEAVCKAVDPVKKELVACFPADAGLDEACFKMNYDILVISVGSINNTFGIKGVDEYCTYFKSIEDANNLRRRVSECFERAALPMTPQSEREKLLSFVVVGGGPTGVEVAAEMYDMVHEDLRKLYPDLINDVRIQVIELMDHVLSTYDRRISEYTATTFSRAGIKLILNSRVSGVTDGVVRVVDKAGVESDIKFGACVWATGIAKNPLLAQLQEQLPGQTHFRSIVTDDFLRVKGSNGSIYALGDAATIDQPKALDYADELFDRADSDKDLSLSMKEVRSMLMDASKRFSHLEEHARFMESKTGARRWGSMVVQQLNPNKQSAVTPTPAATAGIELSEDTRMSKEQFKELLQKIDSGLRALPATAQVARQQGEYLAELFKHNKLTGTEEQQLPVSKSFKYFHKGSLAYVGGDRAVMDVPKVGPIFGWGAGLAWKGFETFSQISLRNQVLVSIDWVRTKVFGRDISRV